MALFYEILVAKPLAALHFRSYKCGSCPLSKQQDTHFLEATKPAVVFFSYETTEDTARKAWFEVYGESLYPIFNSEKNYI